MEQPQSLSPAPSADAGGAASALCGRPVSQWAASLPSESVWDLLLRPENDAESLDPERRRLFWGAVSRRLANHPEDAGVDLYRLYPLHRALMNAAPPDVIEDLVRAFPQAVRTDNYNNDFPLHIACINEHPTRVVGLLMGAYPDALHHRADGLLPLHWAAEWWLTNPGVFDLVLAEGRRQGVGGDAGGRGGGLGGLLVGDKAGHTPLDYICDDVAERGECDAERWGWICDLLRRSAAEALGLTTVGDDELALGMPVLHAALELSCSHQFIQFLLSLDPSAVVRRDLLKRTPLIVATLNPEVCGDIVETLLDAAGPAAARRLSSMADGSGRLPLHQAALGGRDYAEGVDAVLRAAPRALHTRDVETGMYPFMLAAVGEGTSSTNAVFELLRADPSVIMDSLKVGDVAHRGHEGSHQYGAISCGDGGDDMELD